MRDKIRMSVYIVNESFKFKILYELPDREEKGYDTIFHFKYMQRRPK